MVPIVVPTILAALLFGWWYRSSNKRPYFQPSFVESGKIELVTWSLAAADDHARRERSLDRVARARSSEAAGARRQDAQCPGRIARLEMAVHLPDQNVASVNRLVIPAEVAILGLEGTTTSR